MSDNLENTIIEGADNIANNSSEGNVNAAKTKTAKTDTAGNVASAAVGAAVGFAVGATTTANASDITKVETTIKAIKAKDAEDAGIAAEGDDVAVIADDNVIDIVDQPTADVEVTPDVEVAAEVVEPVAPIATPDAPVATPDAPIATPDAPAAAPTPIVINNVNITTNIYNADGTKVEPVKPSPEPTPEEQHGPKIEIVGYETVRHSDGSTTDAAYVRIDGKEGYYVDTDNDGKADFLAIDSDGDGNFTIGEIAKLNDGTADMAAMRQAVPEHPVINADDYIHTDDNHDLANHHAANHATSNHQGSNFEHIGPEPEGDVADNDVIVIQDGLTDIEGHIVDAVTIVENGTIGAVIDVDLDGVADVVIVDENGNGVVDENEIHDLHEARQSIGMDEFRDLVNSDDMASNDQDYINNADISDYEA